MDLLFLCILFFSILQVRCATSNCNAGDPVIVTKLLEKGSYKEAQKLCKVNPSIGNITSYAGFFTVNKKCGSNLFFWFFPALNGNWKKLPLALWLQGGPGSSSLFGLFEELGPFEYNGTLKMREYSWNKESNLLFIDQPVGSGFSYTGNITGCYPDNLTATSKDLYQAIYQFFQLFPNFIENKNNFFITGESYAGKWIPSLALTILENNKKANIKINITSLVIGGAWVHPIVQCIYSSYFYYIGIYDYAAVQAVRRHEEVLVKYIQKEDWSKAAILCNNLTQNIYDKYAGYNISIYNYNYEIEVEEQYADYVQTCDMRKSINVGNKEYQSGSVIYDVLFNDSVQSNKYMYENVLEKNITLVVFGAQLDIVCAYPMLDEVLQSLEWSGQKGFLNATRTKWCITEQAQAGFYKKFKNLHQVFFRSSGHYVPRDQPSWAYLFFKSVITGAPENPLHLLLPCNSTA